MKKTIAFFLLISFLPVLDISAQSTGSGSTAAATEFNMTGFPQWAKDLRRWEIVAFGSFPFTMLIATTGMDLYRWNNFNGMSSSDMRYAPWPLKPAGAVPMTDSEMRRTIGIAVGLSVAVACTDLIIVLIKRSMARKRAAAIPVGTTTIINTPLPDDEEEESSEETEEPEQEEETPSP